MWESWEECTSLPTDQKLAHILTHAHQRHTSKSTSPSRCQGLQTQTTTAPDHLPLPSQQKTVLINKLWNKAWCFLICRLNKPGAALTSLESRHCLPFNNSASLLREGGGTVSLSYSASQVCHHFSYDLLMDKSRHAVAMEDEELCATQMAQHTHKKKKSTASIFYFKTTRGSLVKWCCSHNLSRIKPCHDNGVRAECWTGRIT